MTRLFAGLAGFTLGAGLALAELPKQSEDLFRLTKIWNATLTLDAAQWDQLQPEMPEGGGFPFGGPGGPGGRGPGGQGGGPGGPDRRGPGGPGGPGGFGPGNFLAGGFVANLDQDKDGGVSQAEFTGGFARWFKEWDAKQLGSLSGDDLRDGLNKSLMPQPPGGGGPRPGGGPGGPGGPGFGLQGREGQRNGMSGARGINFEYAKANLEFEGVKLSDVAVRYKGNGTFMDASRTEKKSLKVDLNEFVKGQKVGEVSKLNFHNNITDVVPMHEPLAHELYRAARVPAPRTTWARVTLNAAGAHTNRLLGLYSIVENPDNNWAEHHFGTKKGAIFKPVTREPFKYLGTDWAKYNQTYDPKTDLTPKQQQRVYDFAKLVTDADDAEFARRLPEFLDVDEFSRFMAVTVWLSSTDSILMVGQNYVVYLHPKSDKFLFVPWDLDRAFGNFFSPSPERMSITKAWAEDNRFLERVMKVPAVKEAYLARMKEFQDTIFRPERFAQLVDQVAALVRPVVEQEDPGKLQRFDKAVAGEVAAVPGSGGPGPRFGMNQAKPIKAFTKERHAAVAAQLAGKDEGEPLSGGFGGPGRGPGGPGGRGGGMRGFGPGNFVGPVFLKAADQDADSKVSAAEFSRLAEKWFSDWDKKKTGTLKQEDIVAGLNAVIPPPNFGPPPQ